jgi:restriction system protein
MAEITRKRAGEILRTVYAVLLEHPNGLPAADVIEQAQKRLDLTEYERGEYSSSPGKPRFDKILRFSSVPHVKAGWMTKSRSEGWRVTAEGEEAFRTLSDPAQFQREATRRYRDWKKAQPDESEDEAEAPVIEQTAVATLEEAQDASWAQVKEHLESLAPYDFQDLVAALLRAMGYHVAWIAPPGPDRGIDIVAFTDPLGAEGPRIKVQVKRHTQNRMRVSDMRAFMAVLGDRDVGLFVSASGFTQDAWDEARNQESRRITLIDLENLFDLWVANYDRLSESDKARLPLQPVWFLAPGD